jgi:hypothetical protein
VSIVVFIVSIVVFIVVFAAPNGNGSVKMILVPKDIHLASRGGYNHSGGRAVIEFLHNNNIKKFPGLDP